MYSIDQKHWISYDMSYYCQIMLILQERWKLAWMSSRMHVVLLFWAAHRVVSLISILIGTSH